MDLAVRTTASPAAIWAIVIVAVVCLAFWLIMVMVYANRPDPRRRLLADMPGPVLGGIHMAAGGRSVAPTRDASAVLGEDFLTDLSAEAPEAARVPAQRGPTTPAEAPAEPIPAQRAPASGTAPADTTGTGAGGRP
jgi:hypothetical protein